MEERRQSERCPECQGPARVDANGVVCRNSLCLFNHRSQQCPRCEAQAIVNVSYENEKYRFTCGDCQKVWTA